MNKKKNYLGFGVDSSRTENHFYIVFFTKTNVEIYERYNSINNKTYNELEDGDILKLIISKEKWNMISKNLTNEFNKRLKTEEKPIGKFSNNGTPIEQLLGKEMMILLWSIQDCDESNIKTAISNWNGLQPEERWWLYTMTNASTGGIDDNNIGWRVALRYALCENPIK